MIKPEGEQNIVNYFHQLFDQQREEYYNKVEEAYVARGRTFERPMKLSLDEAISVAARIGAAVGNPEPGLKRMLQNRQRRQP